MRRSQRPTPCPKRETTARLKRSREQATSRPRQPRTARRRLHYGKAGKEGSVNHQFYWPMYWAANLVKPAEAAAWMAGYDRQETTRGPRKVRGTTPGNSRWSYCKDSRLPVNAWASDGNGDYDLTCEMLVWWYRISCMACRLKLSSTLV